MLEIHRDRQIGQRLWTRGPNSWNRITWNEYPRTVLSRKNSQEGHGNSTFEPDWRKVPGCAKNFELRIKKQIWKYRAAQRKSWKRYATSLGAYKCWDRNPWVARSGTFCQNRPWSTSLHRRRRNRKKITWRGRGANARNDQRYDWQNQNRNWRWTQRKRKKFRNIVKFIRRKVILMKN